MIERANPVVSLIRQQMLRHGFTRKQLGHLLSAGKNPTKAFRRLDQLFNGDRLVPEFIQKVTAMLQIPAEQLAVAWEAHEGHEQESRVESGRRAMEEAMEKRGPHLWGILPDNYHPSLFTVLGAEFFLLVRLPEEIIEQAHFEQMREVGQLARIHYQHHRRCRLVGYDYRQSLDAVYRFEVDGEYVCRVDGDPLDSKTFVRIGKQTLNTPCNLLTRGSLE